MHCASNWNRENTYTHKNIHFNIIHKIPSSIFLLCSTQTIVQYSIWVFFPRVFFRVFFLNFKTPITIGIFNKYQGNTENGLTRYKTWFYKCRWNVKTLDSWLKRLAKLKSIAYPVYLVHFILDLLWIETMHLQRNNHSEQIDSVAVFSFMMQNDLNITK